MERIGERIHARREFLEIPLNVLAKGIGISSSMLSQIEKGKAFPSLHTLKHIADYLNTTVGALIGEKETFTTIPVIKWNEKKFVKSNDYKASLYLLVHYSPFQLMEVYSVEIEKGGKTTELLENKRNGQEYCFVIAGKVNVVLRNNSFTLSENDSIYFFSHDLKYIENTNSEKAEILWVFSPLNGY